MKDSTWGFFEELLFRGLWQDFFSCEDVLGFVEFADELWVVDLSVGYSIALDAWRISLLTRCCQAWWSDWRRRDIVYYLGLMGLLN